MLVNVPEGKTKIYVKNPAQLQNSEILGTLYMLGVYRFTFHYLLHHGFGKGLRTW